jgi:glycine cleavage system regulatory protein
MNTTLVLNVLGSDKSGLVRGIAATIAEHGGNWLESRMCRLGGQFAGIVRVELPAERVAALTAALECSNDLRVTFQREDQPPAPAAGSLAALDLVGSDRPGILREVSAVLARHGLNVEELSSERTEAPMAGGQLFQLRAKVLVPPGVELPRVRAELETLAADLMVQLRLDAQR